MPSVSLAAAEPPLVLAIDLGTSSVRALLFDRRAKAVDSTESQISYAMRTPPGGGFETDAAPLFDLLVRSIDAALAAAAPRASDVVAVGATSFWHSLLGLDRDGAPATPLYSWADARSAPDAATLRGEVDPAATLARTGCRLHSSYWPAKLRWLARTQPELVARVHRWVSFADYAAGRFSGAEGSGSSYSMASGTGLLDVHRLVWDGDMLALLGLTPERLSPLVDVSDGYLLDGAFAGRWPALARVPWFPAIGDGAAANAGSGAVGPSRIALTLGTSGAMRLVLPAPPGSAWGVPPELWSYRLDRERAVIGGALSNGGNLLAWLRDLLGVEVDGPAMEAAAALPPDGHGLTILPFVAGERAPGWHDQANGIVAGLTLATRPEHLLRAAMEAVAFRLARLYEALAPVAEPSHEIVANGGAILRSPAWLQITADALGHDLRTLPPEEEASARGAALMALVSAGVLPSLADAPDPAAGGPPYRADSGRHRRYLDARRRQGKLEATLFADG